MLSQYPSVDSALAYAVMPFEHCVGCVKTLVSSQRVGPVCVVRVVVGVVDNEDDELVVVVDELVPCDGRL
jgi:hypothetical protein